MHSSQIQCRVLLVHKWNFKPLQSYCAGGRIVTGQMRVTVSQPYIEDFKSPGTERMKCLHGWITHKCATAVMQFCIRGASRK